MAQSTLLEQGELTRVLHPVGKFANDQRPKFVEASFMILKLNGDDCIMPVCGPSDVRDFQNILSTDSYNLEQVMARNDFGFDTGATVIVDVHQLGDPNNQSWVGCHRFGVI